MSSDIVNPKTIRLTPVTLSGTSVDISIPAGVTKIELSVVGMSTNGVSSYLVRLGDISSVKTTGYLSASTVVSTVVSTANPTIAFSPLVAPTAASTLSFLCLFELHDASTNTWNMSFTGAGTDSAFTVYGGGSIALSSQITTIRLTSTSADTFDAGSAQTSCFFP